MLISKIINKLQEIQKKHGDIHVTISAFTERGEYSLQEQAFDDVVIDDELANSLCFMEYPF